MSGGRYNPKGSFDIFYAAEHEDAVTRETRAVVLDPASGRAISRPHPPTVHLTINVELQSVVDLTDVDIREALCIEPGDLLSEWRTMLAARKTPPTHLIGEAANDAELEALLVPSARFLGTRNIAIIIDRLRIGSSLEIYRPEGFPPGTAIRLDGLKLDRYREASFTRRRVGLSAGSELRYDF